MFRRDIAAAVLFFVALNSPHCLAGMAAYKCEILQVVRASEEGKVEQWKANLKHHGSFNVDRRAGWVVGDFLKNSHAKEIRVLSQGDDEWSFRAFWVFDTGELGFVEIQEWREAKKKPFVAFAGLLVFTGLCD